MAQDNVAYTIDRWQDTEITVIKGAVAGTGQDHEAMLRALAAACEQRPTRRVVLDLTGVDYIPTAAEARSLAQQIAGLAKPARCLMAVVARPGAQFGIARMIESLSAVRDVTVGAFQTVADAVRWMDGELSDE